MLVDPECLQKMVFVVPILRIQLVEPVFQPLHDVPGIVFSKLQPDPVAGAILIALEQFQESLRRLPVDLWSGYQGAAGISDPPDSAMTLIPIWIAQIVLHVTNQRVEPVHHIERSVRAELQIDRAKVAIA